MIKYIIENSKKHPKKTFLSYQKNKYCYEEFLFQIIHSSRILSKYKTENNRLVGLLVQNPLEFLIQWFSCNYLGLITVLFDPKINQKDLQKAVNFTKISSIITERNKISLVKNLDLEINFIEDSAPISLCNNKIYSYDWTNHETTTIIYTSGSDSNPKPVELSLNNFISSFNCWNYEINFTRDKIINVLPLHHIAGISAIFRGLLSGSPILLIDSFKSKVFIKECSRYKPTIISLVPTLVYELLKTSEGINCLKIFRIVLIGGGPSHENILNKCLEYKINAFVTYGMTETCSGISGFWLLKNKNKLGSVGKPFKNIKLYVNQLKDEYSPLYIEGKIVSSGYLYDKRFNFKVNSGDYGKIDDDGYIYLKPLRNDRIVSGGENINPLEIQETILELPSVIKCSVIGVNDIKWGEKVIAFVVRKEKIKEHEIINYCKKNLSSYKIPKKIYFCEDIPINVMGKVNKTKLIQSVKDP